MIALRVCDGAVSNEQRRVNGSSAAAAPRLTAGAATMAIAEATNARRDSDGFMFILLFLGWFTDWRGRDDRRRCAVFRAGEDFYVGDNFVPLVMRTTQKQDDVVWTCKIDCPRVLLCFESTQGYPDRSP